MATPSGPGISGGDARHEPFGAGAEHGDDATTYPIDPRSPIVVDLASQSADVVVRASARADVLVRARGGGGRRGAAGAPPGLAVVAAANRITIGPDLGLDNDAADPGDAAGPGRGRRRGIGSWLPFGRLAAEPVDGIEIETPVGSTLRLAIESGSGDVQLIGLAGDLSVRVGSGDVHLDGCSARIEATTGSGDVIAAGCSGSVSVQSGSGDATIEHGGLRSAQLRTASGDIALRGVAVGDGPFDIHTANGDIRLDLSRMDGSDEPIGLRFRAISGDASVGRGFALLRGRAPADIRPSITVHTVNGDLTARRVAAPVPPTMPAQQPAPNAQPVRIPVGVAASNEISPPMPSMPPVPPAPAQPAAPGDPGTAPWTNAGELPVPPADGETDGRPANEAEAERLALLRAVSRGEIDIEEALRRLDRTA